MRSTGTSQPGKQTTSLGTLTLAALGRSTSTLKLTSPTRLYVNGPTEVDCKSISSRVVEGKEGNGGSGIFI